MSQTVTYPTTNPTAAAGKSVITYNGPPADTRAVKRAVVRARYESDRRNTQPIYAGGGVVTVAGSLNASCTKQIFWDASGIANGATRVATALEMAGMPVDMGVPNQGHYIYRSAGVNGFMYVSPVPDPTVIPVGNAQVQVGKYRFRTNSPISAIGFYAAGGAVDGYKIYIDGQQVSVRPTAAVFIDYVHFSFTDGLYHEIEIRTSGLFFGVFWNPIYDFVKPDAPDNRLTVYTIGDSYSQPLVFTDAGVAGGVNGEGLVQQIEDYLGAGDHYIDAIGGTGFNNRFASGAQAPNNSYLDRLASMQRVAASCDLLIIPNGPANDYFHGWTQAQCVSAIVQYLAAYRALNPSGTIVYGAGHTPPSFGAGAQAFYRAVMAQLVTAAAAIGVYYVDNSGWLTGTGFYGTSSPGPGYNTVSGSNQLTSTIGNFGPPNVGQTIVAAPGIPANTKILSVAGGTGPVATMSATATATATGITLTTLDNRNGSGNTDWAVGADGTHCTGLGYRYLQARFAAKVRKALSDDGTLLNTIL